mmetsp:Transcript_29744/g.95643  ORF Transcript_29744/g.95643 Transcript_29744/m.95643 type:complete len:215 (-) Transcript_29744:167-811(-)
MGREGEWEGGRVQMKAYSHISILTMAAQLHTRCPAPPSARRSLGSLGARIALDNGEPALLLHERPQVAPRVGREEVPRELDHALVAAAEVVVVAAQGRAAGRACGGERSDLLGRGVLPGLLEGVDLLRARLRHVGQLVQAHLAHVGKVDVGLGGGREQGREGEGDHEGAAGGSHGCVEEWVEGGCKAAAAVPVYYGNTCSLELEIRGENWIGKP